MQRTVVSLRVQCDVLVTVLLASDNRTCGEQSGYLCRCLNQL